MKRIFPKRQHPLEILGALFVLAIMLFYTFMLYFSLPYVGFRFYSNGLIGKIYLSQANSLQTGDIILKVGAKSWSDYRSRQSRFPLIGYQAGQTARFSILRDGENMQVDWAFPGPTPLEIRQRAYIFVWLLVPYIFWLTGVYTLLTVRPRDERYKLLVAFNFTIAIWTITGFQSDWAFYGSSIVFHASLWLFLPISWQLHWVLPKSLKPLNRWVWISFYLAAAVAAVIDNLRVLQIPTFQIPLGLALLGSITILALHLLLQPESRRQVMILLTGLILSTLPGVATIFFPITNLYLPFTDAFAYWALAILPFTYFYALYYRRLGNLELRANSAYSLIFYGIFVFLVCYLAIFIIATQFGRVITSTTTILLVALQTAIFTVLVYPHFRRLVEQKILGMPLPPASVLATLTSQAITALDMDQLGQLMHEQIFPSLLVRQAALLRFYTADLPGSIGKYDALFTFNVALDQLPPPAEIPTLIARAGHYIQPPEDASNPGQDWVRLVLLKQIDPHQILLGLWGQRDPDDFYAATELPIFQGLLDNTALALTNIEQAHLLRLLYQDDIERQEQERTRLARVLHDGVLSQLAILAQSIAGVQENQAFSDAYQSSVQRVREIASGLRPPLLNYGLGAALNGLSDEITAQTKKDVTIEVNHIQSIGRYPAEVELHLYRIVQEACLNAVRHSQAQKVVISGKLSPNNVCLKIEDDGVGFDSHDPLDLGWLLANQHFGLVGMHERAELIGAHLSINSTPGKGALIAIHWQAQTDASSSKENANPHD